MKRLKHLTAHLQPAGLITLLPLLVISLSLTAAPVARAQTLTPAQMVNNAEAAMDGTISNLKSAFAAIQPFYFTSAFFSRVNVNYYGSPTPLSQLATISVPETRMAVIQPSDRGMCDAIVKAINAANLGVTASSDGSLVRVIAPSPDLTSLVQSASTKAESAKIDIRNTSRKANEQITRSTAAAADVTRAQRDLTDATQRYLSDVDNLYNQKASQLNSAR